MKCRRKATPFSFPATGRTKYAITTLFTGYLDINFYTLLQILNVGDENVGFAIEVH